MGFPDRIERSISVAHPPAKVWEAITTAEGLGTWFGHKATVDLRVGGLAQLTFEGGHSADLRIERLEPPHVFGYTWGISGLPADDPRRRSILAALASRGPATATDLAASLPITRQAIAKHLGLLTEAGLVIAEPGERRRVRYRLQSAPIQVAQQFLAALARDWDSSLDALRRHLSS